MVAAEGKCARGSAEQPFPPSPEPLLSLTEAPLAGMATLSSHLAASPFRKAVAARWQCGVNERKELILSAGERHS